MILLTALEEGPDMRVLLINKFLYPKGGDAVVTLETGKLLNRYGHKVEFWGMHHPDNPDYQYKDYFIPYVDYNSGSGIGKQIGMAANMFYSLPAKRMLRKLIADRFRPDIVHLHNIAHQISPSILDLFDQLDIPYVMTMHDYKLVCPSYNMIAKEKICERCQNGKYYQCFFQGCVKNSRVKSLISTAEMYLHHAILKIYSKVRYFISPSMFLKTKLQQMGWMGRIEYMPNFVQADDYIPSYSNDGKTVVYFGRFTNEKGIKTLIEAFKTLHKLRLKLIGDGPLKNLIKLQLMMERIENIEICDHMRPYELKQVISNSLLTILPSEWYENNPRSVIESFALGKPVIGSAIGGIPELVKDYETGLTFAPGNAEDLRSKIEHMAEHPAELKTMGQNARRFVENELNEAKHYRQLTEIYEKAME
jgi:glycosyltransferase involved in cell wall biosynthesis